MEGRFCWTFLRSAPDLIASGPKQAPQIVWVKQAWVRGIWNICGRQESVVYALLEGEFCLRCGASHRAGSDARLVLDMHTCMRTHTRLVSPCWAGEVLTAPVGICPSTTHRQTDSRQTGKQTDREAGQRNLMSVFNLLFEVKLKKKIAVMDLNYRGNVSISVWPRMLFYYIILWGAETCSKPYVRLST